jgi:small-conductance mechanosensitive channel
VTGTARGGRPLQSAFEQVGVDSALVGNAVAVLLAAYLLTRVAAAALTALAERSPRYRVTLKMFIPLTRFLVYGVALYVVLGPLLQLSATQLVAVSGLLAAAIGFGLRDLFAGVVGGIVLITEQPYQVGDKVEVDGDYGEVTDIGLRATTLTTADDTAVRVPNAATFTKNVANANDGAPEMLVVVDLAVATDADLDEATAVVRDALVTSKFVFVDDDHPVAVLVDDETYYWTVRGKAYVADLRDEFVFASDVTERSLAAFEERGIETPDIPVERLDGR